MFFPSMLIYELDLRLKLLYSFALYQLVHTKNGEVKGDAEDEYRAADQGA